MSSSIPAVTQLTFGRNKSQGDGAVLPDSVREREAKVYENQSHRVRQSYAIEGA